VNVLLYVTRQIKVDDMLHVRDVQTSSGHLVGGENNKQELIIREYTAK